MPGPPSAQSRTVASSCHSRADASSRPSDSAHTPRTRIGLTVGVVRLQGPVPERCALAPVRSRRSGAAFEQLFELLEVYRHLLGCLPERQGCKQLADAVTLEVEL